MREPPTVGALDKIPAERSRVRVGHPATEGTGSPAARPVSEPENYILHSPRQPETGRGHGRPVSEYKRGEMRERPAPLITARTIRAPTGERSAFFV